jgi:hypothetical protein
VDIREPFESLQFKIPSRYVEYFRRNEGKITNSSSQNYVLIFSGFLINYWTYHANIWHSVIPSEAFNILKFQLNRTRLMHSSHKDIEGNFMVSPKIFVIICWKLRLENCTAWFYGTMNFKFIEWRESLFYIRIFRVSWYFPQNFWHISLKSHPGGFQWLL